MSTATKWRGLWLLSCVPCRVEGTTTTTEKPLNKSCRSVQLMAFREGCPEGFGFPVTEEACKAAVKAAGWPPREKTEETAGQKVKLKDEWSTWSTQGPFEASHPKCFWAEGDTENVGFIRDTPCHDDDTSNWDKKGAVCVQCGGCYGECAPCDHGRIIRWGPYVVQDWSASACSEGTFLPTAADCTDALDAYREACSSAQDTEVQRENWEGPSGCQLEAIHFADFQFNENKYGRGVKDHGPICRLEWLADKPTCYKELAYGRDSRDDRLVLLISVLVVANIFAIIYIVIAVMAFVRCFCRKRLPPATSQETAADGVDPSVLPPPHSTVPLGPLPTLPPGITAGQPIQVGLPVLPMLPEMTDPPPLVVGAPVDFSKTPSEPSSSCKGSETAGPSGVDRGTEKAGPSAAERGNPD